MYAILKQYHYYTNTINSPRNAYLLDAYGDILTFDTANKAQKHIDHLSGHGPCILANGEYAAPSFDVIDMNEQANDCFSPFKPGHKWGDRLIIEKNQIPKAIRSAIAEANVNYSHGESESEIWEYQQEHKGIVYGISYFVRSESSQRAALTGDMSNVDWDHPTFWKA